MKRIVQFLRIFILIWLTVSISCRKEYSCEKCILTNKASNNKSPISVAGPDQSIRLPLNSIDLDGRASSDPDSNIVGYKWTMIAGPSSFTIGNNAQVQTVVTNLIQGIYHVELTVTDAAGLFSRDTMQVGVNSPSSNLPPVADAGPDQKRILRSAYLKLDGSASHDKDGSIVLSLWTQVNGPVPVSIGNPALPVTPVAGFVEGKYTFRLLVTDDKGASDDDTVKIEVVNDTLNGNEIIYSAVWGCNDICADGDVYWDSGPDPSNYFDPDIPVEVWILLNNTSTWVRVLHKNSSTPPINQFSYSIDRSEIWVWAYEGKLIGTALTVKVKFL